MSEFKQEMSSQDLMNASILFSQALNHVLSDKQGIIIYINPESGVNLQDNTTKVVIFKLENSIHVQKYDGDLPEGTVVNLSEPDNSDEVSE
jgi:hypothetical protein